MKLIFKEVGQGDSIILTWNTKSDELINHIGLIDCNLKQGNINPTLDYIKSISIKKIDFIVLSHPHTDHFSGLNQILNYCEACKIKIGYFFHTCFHDINYLKTAVKGNVAQSEIALLYKNILRLYDLNAIEDIGMVSNNSKDYLLEGTWVLSFLAPTQSEFSQYAAKQLKGSNAMQTQINNSDANLLSTLIKIHNNEKYILLTSDVVKSVFKNILKGKRHKNPLKNLEILIGQLPHHGSKVNYINCFWQDLYKRDNTPLIISCGNKYGHPSQEVIKATQILKYQSCQTNSFPKPNPISINLDMISKNVVNIINPISKDWIFDLDSKTLA